MLCRSLILAVLALAIGAGSAAAEIRTRQDTKGTVYEVDGIADNPTDCHPFALQGRTVARQFAGMSATLTGLTVQGRDSDRTVININAFPLDTSMTTREADTDGLQRLSKIGRTMHGRAFACGAAGRVSFLDEIR